MKKELKDQIKEDELKSGLEHAVAWVSGHRDELRIGGLVVLVLAAAVLAITHVRDQRVLANPDEQGNQPVRITINPKKPEPKAEPKPDAKPDAKPDP